MVTGKLPAAWTCRQRFWHRTLYLLVQKAGGLFASLVTYGIPFVSLLWGFIDGEKISWVEIFCLAIILSGVYLANRREKKTGQFDLGKAIRIF